MKRLFTTLAVFCSFALPAFEIIPPTPKQYFNDYANVTSPDVADKLNQQLEQFERDTSSQIVVAIFPHMETDSSIEDYTLRVAQSWKVGQTGKDNGAVLFIFRQNRKLFLQVGYGLEGALPDALCKRIIEEEITPHFRRDNFDAGLKAGVKAILAAARGEYQGKGRTLADLIWRNDNTGVALAIICTIVSTALMIFMLYRMRQQALLIGAMGLVGSRLSRPLWSNVGGSSRGGGNFAGGGGRFGGGGAGGSW